jgi:hypothetical protein
MIKFEKYSNNTGKKHYAKLLIFRCKSPDFGGKKIQVHRLCNMKTSCREKKKKPSGSCALVNIISNVHVIFRLCFHVRYVYLLILQLTDPTSRLIS